MCRGPPWCRLFRGLRRSHRPRRAPHPCRLRFRDPQSSRPPDIPSPAGEDPLRREGYRDGTWVLLDYGCVVVHVFSAEAREFYSLERLWHDGKPVDLSGVLTAD